MKKKLTLLLVCILCITLVPSIVSCASYTIEDETMSIASALTLGRTALVEAGGQGYFLSDKDIFATHVLNAMNTNIPKPQFCKKIVFDDGVYAVLEDGTRTLVNLNDEDTAYFYSDAVGELNFVSGAWTYTFDEAKYNEKLDIRNSAIALNEAKAVQRMCIAILSEVDKGSLSAEVFATSLNDVYAPDDITMPNLYFIASVSIVTKDNGYQFLDVVTTVTMDKNYNKTHLLSKLDGSYPDMEVIFKDALFMPKM